MNMYASSQVSDVDHYVIIRTLQYSVSNILLIHVGGKFEHT
jgi:hypothetical protein